MSGIKSNVSISKQMLLEKLLKPECCLECTLSDDVKEEQGYFYTLNGRCWCDNCGCVLGVCHSYQVCKCGRGTGFCNRVNSKCHLCRQGC